MCLVNRRRLGNAKHVNVQHLWMPEASKSEKFVTKKVGTRVNRRLDDETTAETEN